MPGLKHATKKRFAKSTTRRRTIHSGISSEYTEYRSKLDAVSASVKSLIKEIQAARDVWLAVAAHQNGFAEALVASLPSDGIVRSHAREVEATVRQLRRLILDDESAAAPHRRITAVLEGYLRLVQGVSNEYPSLETTYTEVLRYEKKVDKLTRKGRKKETVLNRNMDKLNLARAEHDRKLQEVIVHQTQVYNKHEAVFQCAHHAFWIAHDKYAHTVNEATKTIRWESVAIREHLVNIDVSNTPKLTAIPRVVPMLPPPVSTPMTTAPFASASTSVPTTIQSNPPVVRVVDPSRAMYVDTDNASVVHIVETPRTPPTKHTTMDHDTPIYTRPAPQPIVMTPTSATLSQNHPHISQQALYTYASVPPIVHLTPDKPSVSVSLPPDVVGPPVPTETPAEPTPIPTHTNEASHPPNAGVLA